MLLPEIHYKQVDVAWFQLVLMKRVDGAPGPGVSGVEPIFVFSPDGFARGGQFAVMRAGRGVQFGVNWLLGTVESATVTGGA